MVWPMESKGNLLTALSVAEYAQQIEPITPNDKWAMIHNEERKHGSD